ncbi:hypothetical protein T4D_7082 [Trichinella pseudospiralis]|uniref:Uncharacterized protein n=1 Tax=Trichinella pseudospiralis TaxID=6337 RepID=A0A0V1DTL7_TRIPS|nr:hypothetical protein T4D_7082 [Trichinella pseudospiralis]
MWLLGIELRTSTCSSPKIYLLLYVTTMWLLGFELRTFGGTVSALNR